ncbi:MAG: response regulator [Acidobacteria bacterium]|nr:response regulator [Acidobacteriota bacterium]MCB9377719.1 response regulator [Holophagales bacterium]
MPDKKGLILCVDDDRDVLDFLDIVLTGAGFEFAGADCAEKGLLAFRTRRPDAVILDMMMEEVDSGSGLAKELRLLGNRAPIFLLSSVGDGLVQATDYTPLGVVGVLQKPIAADQLISLLEATLATAPAT